MPERIIEIMMINENTTREKKGREGGGEEEVKGRKARGKRNKAKQMCWFIPGA